MNATQQYVAGLMFSEDMTRVALIRKNKPAWQRGLLNGIGGKVEDDEISYDAMVREFKEEAGSVSVEPWRHFCSMLGTNNDGEGFEVDFYFTTGDLGPIKSMTSEKIEIHNSGDIASGKEKTIGNLPWLIALAIDFGKGCYPPKSVIAAY